MLVGTVERLEGIVGGAWATKTRVSTLWSEIFGGSGAGYGAGGSGRALKTHWRRRWIAPVGSVALAHRCGM